jgi:hypothetical protein
VAGYFDSHGPEAVKIERVVQMKRFFALIMLILLTFQVTSLAEEGAVIDPNLVEIVSEYLSDDVTTLTGAEFFENDAPKDDVDITVNIGLCWDEDDIVRTACDYAVKTMQKIWDIKSVQTIFFFFTTEMTDQYGNKTNEQIITLKVTREGTAPVNYDNFIEMVHNDYNSLLQICDSATIITPLYDRLKLVKQWW